MNNSISKRNNEEQSSYYLNCKQNTINIKQSTIKNFMDLSVLFEVSKDLTGYCCEDIKELVNLGDFHYKE